MMRMMYHAVSATGAMRNGLPGSFTPIIKAFPFLGGIVLITLVSLLVYHFFRKELGVHLVLLGLFITVTGIILQWSFRLHSPTSSLMETSLYSFPDVHVARITGISIFICFFITRKWLRYASVAAIALVSLSRLYIGASYTRDVIGGLALGILAVWAVSRTIKWFRPVMRDVSDPSMITFMIAFIVSAFGLFKIFIPSMNGGADFLGLFGGVLLGNYLSPILFHGTSPTGTEKTRIRVYRALLSLSVFGVVLGMIRLFIDRNSMDRIPQDIILLGLGSLAGVLPVLVLNYSGKTSTDASEENKESEGSRKRV